MLALVSSCVSHHEYSASNGDCPGPTKRHDLVCQGTRATGIINEHRRTHGSAGLFTYRTRRPIHSPHRTAAAGEIFRILIAETSLSPKFKRCTHRTTGAARTHLRLKRTEESSQRLRQLVSSTPENHLLSIDHIMHFMTAFVNVFVVFTVALMSFVGAAPLATRDVYVPPVIHPHAGAVWKIGSSYNVTWYVTRKSIGRAGKLIMYASR